MRSRSPHERHPILARVWLVASLAGVLTPGTAHATPQPFDAPQIPTQLPEASPTPEPGADLIVTLLTFGPAQNIVQAWAHNAIWIRDPKAGLDIAYEWGVFNLGDSGFLGRLAKGTMMYSMESYPGEGMLRAYANDDRDIFAQELNLTSAQKVALLERVRANDTDANRYYRYQYYLDNCSTRARDAVDAVIGGRIAAALDTVPAGVTWRWHARRILRPMPLAYIGMEFALGNPADETITAWQEGFLPMKLREHLRRVTVLDEAGREVPLVASESQLFQAANRPPEPTDAPFWLPWFLAAGLALAALVGLTGAAAVAGNSERNEGRASATSRSTPRAGGSRLARVGFLLVASGWSFVIGTFGLLLLMAWLFTDHTFWFANENLLQVSPLSLLLAPAIAGAALGRSWGLRWAAPVAVAVLALSLLGFALQPLPGLDQLNGEIIAAALPVHAAVAWVAVRLRREAAGSAAV